VDLSYQEMVNPSKSSRSEGLKAHLKKMDRVRKRIRRKEIWLESILSST
jgi:hypothetical protein